MGIYFRKTREVFITPTLPSSFPYVKFRSSLLNIVIDKDYLPYISLENYLKVMKSHNVIVRTTEELSAVLGVSLIELEDNIYLVNGHLHKIYSLNTLMKALGVYTPTINIRKKNYDFYFDLFKDYFSEGVFRTRNIERSVKDFRGVSFGSISEMCEYHGVTTQTYYNRLRRGITGKDLFKKERIREWL